MIRRVTLRKFKRFEETTFVIPGNVVVAGPNADEIFPRHRRIHIAILSKDISALIYSLTGIGSHIDRHLDVGRAVAPSEEFCENI